MCNVSRKKWSDHFWQPTLIQTFLISSNGIVFAKKESSAYRIKFPVRAIVLTLALKCMADEKVRALQLHPDTPILSA